MGLLATLFLSALIMNPSAMQVDTVRTNPKAGVNKAEPMSLVIQEIAAIQGVNVDYILDTTINKVVKVKVDLNIRFALGEKVLNTPTKELLARFSEIVTKNPLTKIGLVGHTDNISSLELNQNLSVRRAQALADFLVSKNVPASQIKEIEGKNYSEPIADNSTEAGRATNRRAEIYILLTDFPMSPPAFLKTPKGTLKGKKLPSTMKKIIEQVIKKPFNANDIEIEIDGLLIDDTKTKAGKDFYDLFYSQWEAPTGVKNYSITLSEKPFRLTSTLIAIFINEEVVYQAILQPRQELIENQTEEAISMVEDYLSNYEEIMKQLNGDDMAGTGIY